MRALITYDGSKTSESIFQTARDFAALIPDVDLHLAKILDQRKVRGVFAAEPGTGAGAAGTLVVTEPKPSVAESHGQAMERVHQEELQALQKVAEAQFPGMQVTCHTPWSAHTAHAIVRLANEIDADVIVMATHGRSGVSHMIAGSVAEEVIRESKKPVLVRCPK